MIGLKRCRNGCRGQLRAEPVTRVFRRTGSPVEVIIENIPGSVCPVCGQVFFSKSTAQGVDRLLFPFHGRHKVVPGLPPARVIVDFSASGQKAA